MAMDNKLVSNVSLADVSLNRDGDAESEATRLMQTQSTEIDDLEKCCSIIEHVKTGRYRRIAKLLQDHPRCLRAADDHKRTLLILSVQLEREDVRRCIAKMLIQAGCDINACDEDGRTALSYACANPGKENMIRILINTSLAVVNTQDSQGRTAIMHAVLSNNSSAISILSYSRYTKPFLDVNLRDHSGNSPLELAIQLRHGDCCRSLVEEGAASTDYLTETQKDKLSLLVSSNQTYVSLPCTPCPHNPFHSPLPPISPGAQSSPAQMQQSSNKKEIRPSGTRDSLHLHQAAAPRTPDLRNGNRSKSERDRLPGEVVSSSLPGEVANP